MPVINIHKTDWFRVLSDISRAGYSLQKIAYELDVATSTLVGWKQGAIPRHHTGEALIAIWMRITGLERDQLPALISKKSFIIHPIGFP
ncbi:hypothetical protein [Pantoea sp. ME81]|uniref:hypothetical protein n=1 Tax=Pantoea TaxID=53335 RepID=UPI0015F46677|nr:hypothetical protein [Pantoea sp. ME81]